mmetsp:Transcript_41959/g.78468  ORF Transcript_41959/g.78468 Transcript_41959/m.78468 type:complete len:448 (+) Transcript_41959:71-1414(+)
MSVGPGGGAMRLRCWELASSDTRRPSSTQTASTRIRTPRDRSKLLQRSRIAQPSDKTLDAAQKTLDSLSGSFRAPQASNLLETEKYNKCEDWDLGPASPAEHSTRGILLPPGEKERFYGSFSGTQVEAELKRLAMLVKGLLRDLTIVKDSVWHLEDERQEVKEKLDQVENVFSLGEAKKNEQLLKLTGQVEMLEARLTASDDSTAQIAELAGQVELLDARLSACEDVENWRCTKQPSTEAVLQDAMMGANLLVEPVDTAKVSPVRPISELTDKRSIVRAVRAATYRVAATSVAVATMPPGLPTDNSQSEAAVGEDVQTGPKWGRPSLPDNHWPEGRVPPGQSMRMKSNAASDASSPSSCANVAGEAALDFGTMPTSLTASTAVLAVHGGPSQEAAAGGCSPVPEDKSVLEETPPKMRGMSAASTASGPAHTPQPSEQLSSTGKSQLL